MPRTKITQESTNRVTLVFTWDGEIIEREFMVPHGGGYVREWKAVPFQPPGWDQQVCDRLDGRGNTLWCQPEELIHVIRSEWRKHRADLKRLDAPQWR